jgi:hypothetical protein
MSKEGFESVKQAGATWEPKQTGSTKQGNLQSLEAGDDSYIIGWYLGAKHGVGKNNSTIHGLQVKEVGNDSHVVGELDPNTKKINIWGTGVLDNIIADNVQPGQCIMITWLGVQKNKSGGKDYHGWDVGVNPSIEPIPVGGVAPMTAASSSTPQAAPAPVAAEASMDEEEDDLPF